MTPLPFCKKLRWCTLAIIVGQISMVRAQTPNSTSTVDPGNFSTGGASPIRAATNDFYTKIYRIPTPAEVTDVMQRVRTYMENSTPGRLVDRSGQEITDFSQPIAGAALERGGPIVFNLITYEQGVVFTGMLAASDATGDRSYDDFVAKRLSVMANYLKIAPPRAGGAAPAATTPAPGGGRRGGGGFGLGGLTTPSTLDQCGAMCTGLIQARLANVGPDLRPVINAWMDFIDHKVPRLADGTIARHIPMPDTIWADDMYMSAPALADMGKLTGDKKYFDDAAKQIIQMSARLFRPDLGIYAHGWITTNPDPVDIHWSRANGWCILAMCSVLDVLPLDHPSRNTILTLLRAHLRGIAKRQSDSGLWHQLIDRDDSYLETSASAMFVYGMAHAINQGWISPAYGTEALTGWNAVATRVNNQGQVEGTCVGTNFDLSLPYYYARPTSVNALHGYGPVLMAGAEVFKLLNNDKLKIALSVGSIYVSPVPGQPMPWLEQARPAVTKPAPTPRGGPRGGRWY